jgi:2,4-dienoyl-CoA reductase-like NADH-dependent reductase (Old Yellow Enzyme family)
VGGAGLIIAEATAVNPAGRISLEDLGIWNDEHIEPLKRITDFIKKQGAVCGIQLAHAGRKASTSSPWKGHKQLKIAEGGWQTNAPSPLPFNEDDSIPKEMSVDEINEVTEDFVNAAIRSIAAGFQVIEIHAAHGYLLNQFFSPLTNERKDNYGGSFENRARLLLEIIEKIRAIIPEDMPLLVRLSVEEWAPGGNTVVENIKLAKLLKLKGADLIDCSSGGVVKHQKIPVSVGYQVPFAQKIKQEAEMPTAAVGLITTADQAEAILQEGKADLIFFGRELLRNPYFALQHAPEFQEAVDWPKQYERAIPRN